MNRISQVCVAWMAHPLLTDGLLRPTQWFHSDERMT